MSKTKSKKDALEDRLGAVLGRFWVVLGAVLEGKNRLKPCVLNGFVKNHVFEKIRCQEATWDDLGPIWSAKGVQNGAQEGAETEQKKRRKMK